MFLGSWLFRITGTFSSLVYAHLHCYGSVQLLPYCLGRRRDDNFTRSLDRGVVDQVSSFRRLVIEQCPMPVQQNQNSNAKPDSVWSSQNSAHIGLQQETISISPLSYESSTGNNTNILIRSLPFLRKSFNCMVPQSQNQFPSVISSPLIQNAYKINSSLPNRNR